MQVKLETAAIPEQLLSRTTFEAQIPSYDVAHRQTVREDDRNVLILHSSGTTGMLMRMHKIQLLLMTEPGLPKAIPLAHRYVLGYAACHSFPPDKDMSVQGVNLSTLPLFHVRCRNMRRPRNRC